MKTRAAILTEPRTKLIVDEVDIPETGEDQVLVKLLSSGICHSQLHQMENENARCPLLLGHEGTGIVTNVGRRVSHLKEGDHAIVTWVPRIPYDGPQFQRPTGVSYMGTPLNGNQYTWAEDVLVDSTFVVGIPAEYASASSCIVGCAVLTGAGAVLHTAKVRPGESVAVFGVGGVGLCSIRMAAILEAYPIIAVDLKQDKLELARQFGATHLVNASDTDPIEAIHEITKVGADYAFDTIGVQATNEQILPSTRAGGSGADNQGGMAVLVGLPGGNITVNSRLFVGGQRQYRGSLGATYTEKDFPMYLKLYSEGKFPLDKLVTRTYKLDQINEACDALKGGEILGRSIIDYTA